MPESYWDQLSLPGIVPVALVRWEMLIMGDGTAPAFVIEVRGPDGSLLGLLSRSDPVRPERSLDQSLDDLRRLFQEHVGPF